MLINTIWIIYIYCNVIIKIIVYVNNNIRKFNSILFIIFIVVIAGSLVRKKKKKNLINFLRFFPRWIVHVTIINILFILLLALLLCVHYVSSSRDRHWSSSFSARSPHYLPTQTTRLNCPRNRPKITVLLIYECCYLYIVISDWTERICDGGGR